MVRTIPASRSQPEAHPLLVLRRLERNPAGRTAAGRGGRFCISGPAVCLRLACGVADGSGIRIAAAAEKYSGLADAISDTMRPKYWDARKGMFADTFSRSDFSQHVNVLAILCGVVEGEEASALLHRITDDRTVMPCSVFFRYYLQQAMKLTGNGAMLFDGLRIWRDQLALGLTTWAEQPEPSRFGLPCVERQSEHRILQDHSGYRFRCPGIPAGEDRTLSGRFEAGFGAVPHPAGKIGVDYEADGPRRSPGPDRPAGGSRRDICLAGKGVFVERGPAGDDGPVTV